MSGRNMTFTLIVALVLFIASNALYVIKETERGVLLQFGEVVNPNIQPGLQVKIPLPRPDGLLILSLVKL